MAIEKGAPTNVRTHWGKGIKIGKKKKWHPYTAYNFVKPNQYED
jgi:hypothetical protein